MKKTIIALLLAGMMTVSLAGCEDFNKEDYEVLKTSSDTITTTARPFDDITETTTLTQSDSSNSESENTDLSEPEQTTTTTTTTASTTTTTTVTTLSVTSAEPTTTTNEEAEWFVFGESTALGGKAKVILMARDTSKGVELACEVENNYSEEISFFGLPSIIVDGYEHELTRFSRCETSSGAKTTTVESPYLVRVEGVKTADDIDGFIGEIFTMKYSGNDETIDITPDYR